MASTLSQQHGVNKEQILPMLQALQMDMDHHYSRQQSELNNMYHDMLERIESVRRGLKQQGMGACGGNPSAGASLNSAASLLQQHRQRNQPIGGASGGGYVPSTPPRNKVAPTDDLNNDWGHQHHRLQPNDVMQTPPHGNAHNRPELTPTGSPQSIEKVPIEQLFLRLSQTTNSPPINFDLLYEQLAGKDDSPQMPSSQATAFGLHQSRGNTTAADLQSAMAAVAAASPGPKDAIPMDSLSAIHGQHQTQSVQVSTQPSSSGRPRVAPIPQGQSDDPRDLSIDPQSRCQVLVEFKRKRVLQFDSSRYVGPGEYVVVGGDRGEDVGLVIYTWCETTSKTVKGIGLAGSSLTRNIGVGSGTVLRLAGEQDVAQLHNVQSELERRAVDVCMQRVLEHGLPMVIVDAEYQFDKKKLTFFYEAQQRMDFRELVRDLFKTFRARIWMELVEN